MRLKIGQAGSLSRLVDEFRIVPLSVRSNQRIGFLWPPGTAFVDMNRVAMLQYGGQPRTMQPQPYLRG